MARMIDLTEKLGLAEKPTIKITDDVTLTVDDSARTIMRVMVLLDNSGAKEIEEACDLLFNANSKAALDALFSLGFDNYMLVVQTAVDMVVDGVDEGNAQTPATT